MKKSAFLIHGSGGSNDSHWFPWLKNKLENKGVNVIAPQFPIEKNQTLDNWLKTFDKYKEYLDNSIVIGHSLGVPFILNVLNNWNINIKAAYFVSGFVGKLNVDEPNLDDFAIKDFNWTKIKANCNKFYVINSDNDPYVPLNKADELAKYLNTRVILVKNGFHFQKKSGYNKFELLFKHVEKEL